LPTDERVAGRTVQRESVPVEAVLVREDGEGTGLLAGEARFGERGIRFDLDELRVDCRYGTVERAAIDTVPAELAERFEDGLVLRWVRDGIRWQAVIDIGPEDLGPGPFAARVCGAVLDGTEIHVEQTATPTRVDAGTDPETRTVDTGLTVDPVDGTVSFETPELRPVRPATTTVTEQENPPDCGAGPAAVKVHALTAERTVETRIVPPTTRKRDLLADHVANALSVSEDGGPIRVLFVDDEPGLVELAKLHLGDYEDLSIEFATTTPRAVDLVGDGAYECVVTDYAMPEGGAPEVLQAVRGLDARPPVVVLSRQDPDELADDEVPPGVDVWATKEVGPDQYHRLAGTIRRLVAPQRGGG
jgi:CheY-like chemotaxis protein